MGKTTMIGSSKRGGNGNINFGMELFGNLSLSGKQDRLENNQRKLRQLFEIETGDMLAQKLYRREVPFTIQQFEGALVQLEDKSTNKLGWRGTRLVRGWLKTNLSYLHREREREQEDNFRIKL